MFLIIWEYKVKPDKTKEFEEYYGKHGLWVELFKKSAHYIDTDFLRKDESDSYATIDKWDSPESYENFIKENKNEYDKIDKLCADFTITEKLIGKFFKS